MDKTEIIVKKRRGAPKGGWPKKKEEEKKAVFSYDQFVKEPSFFLLPGEKGLFAPAKKEAYFDKISNCVKGSGYRMLSDFDHKTIAYETLVREIYKHYFT